MSIFIVCLAGFFGALVDAIVGGGGLITIPALLSVGLPTHLALGTNKFASSFGTISSAYHYYKSGEVEFSILKFLIPLSLVGSALGVLAVLAIDPTFLKGFIIVMVLIIGLYTLLKKNLGLINHPLEVTRKKIKQAMGLSLGLGFYDGFFGPGTGSFLIFGMIHIFGFDFRKASANSKFLNFASNLTSLVLFLVNGKIMFTYGIPMAIAMIIGGRVGTHLAVTKGAQFIKPVFVLVSFGLVLKLSFDLFAG